MSTKQLKLPFSCRLLVALAWMAGMTDGVTQKCYSFSSSSQYANTYDEPRISYYWCEINGNLQNEQEEVTTDTSGNRKSNNEVTAVFYYTGNMVKFIPNSLFTTFVNLECLYIHSSGNKPQ